MYLLKLEAISIPTSQTTVNKWEFTSITNMRFAVF